MTSSLLCNFPVDGANLAEQLKSLIFVVSIKTFGPSF